MYNVHMYAHTYYVKFLASLAPRIHNYKNHVVGMSVYIFFLATENYSLFF